MQPRDLGPGTVQHVEFPHCLCDTGACMAVRLQQAHLVNSILDACQRAIPLAVSGSLRRRRGLLSGRRGCRGCLSLPHTLQICLQLLV